MKQKLYLIILAAMIVVQSLAGTATANNSNKLKLMVLSELDKHKLDKFYNEIALSNPMFDPNARPEEIEDADFVVFLLEDWGDIKLYFDGALPFILETVRSAPPNATRFYVQSQKRDGSLVHVIFYSRGGTNGKSLACYAEDIAAMPNGDAGMATSESCH
ncbi:hypothetical protein [Ruegeria atlantica]|uniref:hypothetical protein n=1 Tax=Ruegeria atlantica TaxID=81569 RepID=UPI002494E6F3|nr:hypothetical protein [Ruegeria atlantica]